MQSMSGLIVRVERAQAPDRLLDSEIVAAVLGPPGCVIDPIMGVDGWDIQFQPDDDGEAAYWREAADVPGVTAFLDAACEVVAEARPSASGSLMARALRQMPEPESGATASDVAGQAARAIMAELLRTIAVGQAGLAQAA